MAMIMIKCLQTGKDIPTGFGTTEEGYRTSEYVQCQTQCPVCGQVHTWDKKDTFLRKDGQ